MSEMGQKKVAGLRDQFLHRYEKTETDITAITKNMVLLAHCVLAIVGSLIAR
jgi:uncharacterized protein YutE (UPF0331/DUF86 family)